ncbi:MAG: hypothetical protein H8D43_01610 [Chloroflexi bacterium]|nr:hypothetical protein [Chloroflexota bacterium]
MDPANMIVSALVAGAKLRPKTTSAVLSEMPMLSSKSSSESKAGSSTSRYEIHIDRSKGTVIGDHARVEQHFHATLEPELNLEAAEARYRQQVVAAYNRMDSSGFESGDLFLEDVPLESVFVRLTLTVEKVIREPVPPE